MRVLGLCTELLQALQGTSQSLVQVIELTMEAEALRLLEMLVAQPASSARGRIKERIANVQLHIENCATGIVSLHVPVRAYAAGTIRMNE